MGQRLRTCQDLLMSSVEKHIEDCEYSSMVNRTGKRGLRQFHVEDAVLARSSGTGEKWIPGVVTEVLGSRQYMAEVLSNLWKRHVDQKLRRSLDDTLPSNSTVIQRHFVTMILRRLWDNRGRLFLIPLFKLLHFLLQQPPMNLI